MSTVDDIRALRNLGWGWTRIAAHYRVSEREVRRWLSGMGVLAAPSLPPPLVLRYATALVVNDAQFPHHDPALWEVTTQIAVDNEVETIVYNGDMLDFEQLSSFRFDPHKTKKAEQDVEDFHEQMRWPLVRAVEKVLGYKPDEVWLDGNHEDRYVRFMQHHAAALGNPNPRKFLRVEDMEHYYPYGPRIGHMLTPRLACTHGWKVTNYAAKDHMVGMGSSVIFGHTHGVSVQHLTTANEVWGAYECGHMTIPGKVPGYHGRGKPDWQLVAGTLVRHARKGDSFDVDILNTFGAKDDKVIVGNREYHISR